MFNLPLQNSVLKSRTSAVHRFKWDFVFVVVISVHSMYMLSTPLVVSHYFSAKVSPEWRLNLGFGTQKKCPFPLNRSVPSLEVTDAKIMWTIFGTKVCVPWMEVSLVWRSPKGEVSLYIYKLLSCSPLSLHFELPIHTHLFAFSMLQKCEAAWPSSESMGLVVQRP